MANRPGADDTGKRPYEVHVRTLMPRLISKYSAQISLRTLGNIEISNAAPDFAETLACAISDSGGTSRIVDCPREGNICLLTEGLVLSDDPAKRHFRVLDSLIANAGRSALMYALDYYGASDLSGNGGNAGLCRSFRAEHPGAGAYSLSLDAAGQAETLANWVIHALKADAGDYTLRPDGIWRDEAGPHLSPPRPEIAGNEKSVWLVTGGARGVTAVCAIELARRTGGVFLLLGRSSALTWPEWLPRSTDVKGLRALLAQNAPRLGIPKRPADIERFAQRLLASAEVSDTLAAIEKAGASAHYLEADIAMPDDVARVLGTAQQSFGQVTGLIHGAGVLSDGRAQDLCLEDFRNVFWPKVDGLSTVLSCLNASMLQHIALFSSASAVFGNRGQTNYAAANAWLNNAAVQLSQTLPDAQVKSFCWGPWQGGMVDEGLARLFAARGIGLISKSEGARIFSDLLLHSPKEQVCFVIGEEWANA